MPSPLKSAIRNRQVWGCLLAVWSLSGCGGSRDAIPTVEVSGVVTLDGQPVDSGYLTLIPSDGMGAPAGMPITEGKFEGRTQSGIKNVSISAPVVVGERKIPNPGGETVVKNYKERVASEFNSRTKLTCDIPKKGTKELHFEVTSAKK